MTPRSEATTVSGILNVDKGRGFTSFDVVAMVRRGTGVRKVGHAGTLDPLATGVLLVCLGQAVRLSEYLMELPKTYHATIALGRATDTYDAEGQTTSEANPGNITREHVERVLGCFVGEIQQPPPPFSAVKVGGKRAYTLARRGEAVALAERPVQVYRLKLLSFAQSLLARPEVSKERAEQPSPDKPGTPLLEIEVECGKGTYIRSLAHDVGRELGCGAHLATLVRTRIGPFAIESATTIEALEAAYAAATWRELLLPLEAGVAHLPSLTVTPEQAQALRHGRPLPLEAAQPAGRCRAMDESGTLVAVLEHDAEGGVWQPRKVFG